MSGAIEINQKNKSLHLRINTLFYDQGAVLSCVGQFRDFCDISYSDTGRIYFELTLIPKGKEYVLENIGYEFFNALLAEVKNK